MLVGVSFIGQKADYYLYFISFCHILSL